jgi:hypothetical protein
MAKGRRFIFLRDNNPGWRVARRMLAQVMSEVRLGRMVCRVSCSSQDHALPPPCSPKVRLSEFECKYTMQRIMKNPEDWKAQFQRLVYRFCGVLVYATDDIFDACRPPKVRR